ncbi:MAG: hypothetical protein AB7O50_16315 [Pseudolabrys sp.]
MPARNAIRAQSVRFAAALVALSMLLVMAPVLAQSQGQSLFSTAPSSTLAPPGTPGSGAFAPPTGELAPSGPPPLLLTPPGAVPVQPVPMVPAGQVALQLGARFGKDAAPITSGLIWRVYAAKPDTAGTYRLLREEKSAAPTLVLPAGNYVVYVGFGLANAVKPVRLTSETVRETFDLPAGGLRLEGRVGDARIPAGQISFDVYRGSQFEPGDRRPIAERVLTGDTVIVPEGTYYIVSNYGDANSTVRSDIRVQAGKLTDVTVTHRAAIVTLKLVAVRGGEALANTAWSVLTPGGDVIKESIGAFPRVVLAEGEYRAIARNEGKVFERDFKVITGVDGDIEVLTR